MTDQELARVHQLHPGPVHEAEVVSDAEWAKLQTEWGRAEFRLRGYGSTVVQAGRVSRTVATHDRTRTVAKGVARNVAYVPLGGREVWRWWRENCTGAGYARAIRDAELRNDFEQAAAMRARADDERHRRFERVMAYIKAPQELAKAAAVFVVGVVFVLLALGVAAAVIFHDPTLVTGPIRAVMWCVATVVWLFTVGGTAIVGGGMALVVVWLWAAGRRAGDIPDILQSDEVIRAEREEITPGLAVTAFRDLGIAELRKRIQALPDGGAPMLSHIRPAGCGVEFDATPPRGATSTAAILARHDRLAENLGRHPHEVHLSVPAAGVIRTWAADPGALDEPIDPSPLVADDKVRADYRRGKAPFGVGLRNNRVGISLHQKHVLVAGMSAQGKTKTMRALALWLALDPNVELWVADLKGFNDETGESDWEMFRNLASRFVAGPSDEHVVEAVEMLEDASAEMKRRLTEGGKYKPLVTIVDEVQSMYMSPVTDTEGRHYGGVKSTSRGLTAVRELHNQGRVVDTTLWEGTQDPSNQNYPVLARNGIHLRISTAISTEAQARMVLQDKAVDAGAAPHLLRLGKDKGTVVVAGDGAPLADDELFAHVRVHYIDDKDAWGLATRAAALRRPPEPRQEQRDLLGDVADVMGQRQTVKAADMPGLLRKLAPGYRLYEQLNGVKLAEMLGELGVSVKDMRGVLTVRRERVWDALNDRDPEDGEDL